MEPTFLVMGEAAGVAASHAIKANTDFHEIDFEVIRADLQKPGVITEWDGTGYWPAGWSVKTVHWHTHPEDYKKIPIRLDPSWEGYDADKDEGGIRSHRNEVCPSADYWKRKMPGQEWLFPHVDMNGDGKIMLEEYRSFLAYEKKDKDWAATLKTESIELSPRVSGGTVKPEAFASVEDWNRKKRRYEWLFPFIDKNADGKISLEEHQAFQDYKKKDRNWGTRRSTTRSITASMSTSDSSVETSTTSHTTPGEAEGISTGGTRRNGSKRRATARIQLQRTPLTSSSGTRTVRSACMSRTMRLIFRLKIRRVQFNAAPTKGREWAAEGQ